MKIAKDIMTKNVITIDSNEQLKKAISKMESKGVKEIPVVDESTKLVGMITYYDILDSVRADPDEKISNLIVVPPVAGPKTPVEEIMALMVKTGMEAIPIVENEKLIGLISDYDVLRALLKDKELKGLKVKEIMNEDVKLLKEDETISEARRLMRYNRWEKLPIADENGKLIGIIKSMDILARFYHQSKEKIGKKSRVGEPVNPLQMPVSSLLKKDIPGISPEENVSKVLGEILDKNLKGVPVVDEKNRVIGMFNRWAVLDKLVKRKFKEGVWINFSGFQLKVQTVELIKEYIKSDIKRLKQMCPELESINVYIKKMHGATPDKWNYEVNVKLMKSAGKGEFVTRAKPWYGYNLVYTLQDAFGRLVSLMEKQSGKRTNKKRESIRKINAA